MYYTLNRGPDVIEYGLIEYGVSTVNTTHPRGVDPELTRGCAPGPPARLQRVDKCETINYTEEKDLTSGLM